MIKNRIYPVGYRDEPYTPLPYYSLEEVIKIRNDNPNRAFAVTTEEHENLRVFSKHDCVYFPIHPANIKHIHPQNPLHYKTNSDSYKYAKPLQNMEVFKLSVRGVLTGGAVLLLNALACYFTNLSDVFRLSKVCPLELLNSTVLKVHPEYEEYLPSNKSSIPNALLKGDQVLSPHSLKLSKDGKSFVFWSGVFLYKGDFVLDDNGVYFADCISPRLSQHIRITVTLVGSTPIVTMYKFSYPERVENYEEKLQADPQRLYVVSNVDIGEINPFATKVDHNSDKELSCDIDFYAKRLTLRHKGDIETFQLSDSQLDIPTWYTSKHGRLYFNCSNSAVVVKLVVEGVNEMPVPVTHIEGSHSLYVDSVNKPKHKSRFKTPLELPDICVLKTSDSYVRTVVKKDKQYVYVSEEGKFTVEGLHHAQYRVFDAVGKEVSLITYDPE